MRAIKNIEKILGKACKSVNILGDLEHSEIKEANEILIENLIACDDHLSFTFKKNLAFSNEYEDHCATHALSSDKDPLCNHSHRRTCEECNS